MPVVFTHNKTHVLSQGESNILCYLPLEFLKNMQSWKCAVLRSTSLCVLLSVADGCLGSGGGGSGSGGSGGAGGGTVSYIFF